MMSWREIGIGLRRIMGVALIAVGLALPAFAQSGVVELNIPPQELSTALAALAEQANVQVLYASELAGNRLTKGVTGTMSPEDGIRQVLDGTGLHYVFTDGRTITLQQAPVSVIGGQVEPAGSSTPPAKQKPVKVPEIVVKEVRERNSDTTSYVAEEANTATRTDTAIRDVPQSIQVITRKVLEEQRTFRLQDSLENVSGITVADSGASLYEYINIRGFAATDRSYFRNGLIDPFAQFTAMDTYNVRRLEVLKGPAAVLYGQGDPGGVINIVTNKPQADAAYSASTTIGNFNFYRSELDATGPLNASKTVLYRLNVAGQKANSFIDFANRDLAAIAPSVTWLLGSRTTFTVDADYMRRWSNDPQGLPAEGTVWGNINGNIPRNRSTTLGGGSTFNRSSYRIGYDLTHQFDDQWSIRNIYRHTIVEDDRNNLYLYPLSLDADQRTLNRSLAAQPAVARRHAHSMVTNVVGRLRLFDMDHTLLTGVELRQEKTDQFIFTFSDVPPLDLFAPNYSLVPLPPTEPSRSSQSDNKTAAFYVQDQITLLPNLKFTGGLRFDYVHQSTQVNEGSNNSDHTGISPRLGLVYQPIEPISLYTSWNKGFQPSSPGAVNPNGALFKPERSTQYEVGVKTVLMENRLSATLAWYHLTRENLLTPNPDPGLAALGFSVQTGEQRSQGIELDVTAQVMPGWNIITGYAYTDAEVTKDNDTTILNKRLANVPYNKFTLWSTYHVQEGALKGFGVGGGLFAYSSRAASIFGDPITMPAYVRADAALYYNHALDPGNWLGAKGLNVALNIRNLLDQRYVTTGQSGTNFFFYGEPFTVLGTVGLRF